MRERLAWGVVAALGLLVAASLAGVVSGGPLDPPGPPASTMKPLDQVEPRIPISSAPFTINQPGSYYLTSNIGFTGSAITVTAPDVEIDLMGFTIFLNPGINSLAVAGPSAERVTVRNGNILGGAILLGADARIEHLRVEQTVSRDGISVGTRATVRDCWVQSADGRGIFAISSATVERCIVADSTGDGILVGNNSQVLESHALRSGAAGVNAGSFSVIKHVIARENATTGITAGGRSSVISSRADFNIGDGIVIGSGAMVQTSAAQSNGRHGIVASAAGTIVENIVSGNGAAAADGTGIRLADTSNHVRSNFAFENDIGIHSVAGRTTAFSNTARANPGGDFIFQTNDTAGPVLNAAGVAAAAPHPFANFTP